MVLTVSVLLTSVVIVARGIGVVRNSVRVSVETLIKNISMNEYAIIFSGIYLFD